MLSGIMQSPHLSGSHIALVETDPQRCEQMGHYAEKINQDTGGKSTISYSTNRCDVLEGSDFVLLTFSVNNIHSRGMGAHICKNYGVIECSGDTAGPGSVLRIIREIPLILEVARDIERLAPDAMVLNYVNPTNVVGAALDRYTKLKWAAFCDGMYLPYFGYRLLEYMDLPQTPENAAKMKFDLSGINHFGWMTALSLDGEDLWPRLKDGLKRKAELKGPQSDERAEWDLLEAFNAWPTVIWHTKEYHRYFQGRGHMPQRDFVVRPWDLHERVRWVREFYRKVDSYNAGEISRKEALGEGNLPQSEMVVEVMESLVGNLGKRFAVNVRNEGRVTDLPDSAIVELFGTIDAKGIHVPKAPPLPLGPRAMVYACIDQQELALEAAMTGSFELAARAVACDPLVMSLSDAVEITRDLLAAEQEYLAPMWDTYWATAPNQQERDRLAGRVSL
jgi:alpha-galactosidase